MADNEFIFKINGPGVSPATVDVYDLAQALVLLKRTLIATAKGLDGPAADVRLSLTGIEEGSDKLTLAGTPAALASTLAITLALAAGRPRTLPVPAVQRLHELSQFIEWNEWESCSFASKGANIVYAKIEAGDERFLISETYSGQSVIYGECLRVGGDHQMSAFMRLTDGSRRAIRLTSRDIAQQLGQRLYQTVGLSGVARWRTDTQEMVYFIADSLLPFSDRDKPDRPSRTMTEAFSNLSKVAGTRWNDVDPDEFVLEQRRD